MPKDFGFGVHCGLQIFLFLASGFRFSSEVTCGFSVFCVMWFLGFPILSYLWFSVLPEFLCGFAVLCHFFFGFAVSILIYPNDYVPLLSCA